LLAGNGTDWQMSCSKTAGSRGAYQYRRAA
jgi:hypothetical protein